MSGIMTYFNLGEHCEATMTAKSVGGLVTKVHVCSREKNHPGPHRSVEGLIWINPKQIRNEELNG